MSEKNNFSILAYLAKIAKEMNQIPPQCEENVGIKRLLNDVKSTGEEK
jgi:hypothetical protein